VNRIRQVLVSLALGTCCATLLALPPVAEARPEYVAPFAARYPSATDLSSCGTCHTSFFGGTARNAYGAAFEAADGKDNQNAALLVIEALDSDGDGTTNIAEISTGSGFMPGYSCATYTGATDAPADLADYVDPNNVGCSSVTTTTVPGGTTTTTTLPLGLCGASPRTTCRAAGKAAFQVKDKAGEGKDQVKWTWQKGEAFTAEELGDPLGTTSYALCIYDHHASAPELVMNMGVTPNGGWKSKGSKGWQLKDARGVFAGIQKLQLKAGDAGKTKAQIKAKGASIPMPLVFSADQFFAKDPTVTVQLINSNGICWTSDFTDTKKNTPTLFKGK